MIPESTKIQDVQSEKISMVNIFAAWRNKNEGATNVKYLYTRLSAKQNLLKWQYKRLILQKKENVGAL